LDSQADASGVLFLSAEDTSVDASQGTSAFACYRQRGAGHASARPRVPEVLAGLYGHLLDAWEWIKAVAGRFSRLLRPFAVFCTIAFVVLTVANAAKIPKEEWWQKGDVLPWVLIGVGLVTAVRQTIVYVDRRRRKRRTALDDGCRQIAAHIDSSCPNVQLRHVGIHVWRVAGPWFARHLEREAKFLIRDRRGSAVPWTKGKGVFGLAWEEKAPVIIDLDNRLYPLATTQAAFMARRSQDRLGLSWDEIQRTKHYKTIYAAPLFTRSSTNPAILGLVAVDLSESGHYQELYDATVQNDDFNSILGICEGALVG
jgi:hypothetical protein